MRGDWPEVPLTDVYTISSGLSKPASDFGSGYPFVAFKDIFYNYFLPENLIQLVQSSEIEREKCSVLRGDVFLTRTSETMHELGMSSVALRDYEGATFNGFSKRLRPKQCGQIYPEYVGYFLRSAKFRQMMSTFSTMSTRASLNNEMIGRLKLSVPPVKVQRSIAHVLKTLDDKIELNRQTNETLEAMAQAMFKSWFVDFDPVIDNALAAGNDIPEPFQARAAARQTLGDARKPLPEEIRCEFPDEFVFSDEMGWVPRGWELSTVHDEFTLKGGATPSTKNSEYWEFGTIPWTTPKDLSDNETKIMFRTSRCITEAGLNKIGSGLLPLNTVLMSSRAPVGYLAIPKIPLAINQGYIALICDSKITATYAIQWLASIMDDIKQRAGGTTFAEISKKNFRDIPIFVPGEKCIQAYSAHVEPWYESIANELVGIDRLTQFRDTLLPKLLSGQLTVPNAEKLVAEEL